VSAIPVSKKVTRRGVDARKERRAGFMSGAAEVFAEHGFQETTMDMLSEHLSVAKVILYRHFASKDDLIHCILEEISEKIVALDASPEETIAQRALDTLALARGYEADFVSLVRHARNHPLFGVHYENVHNAISSRVTIKLLGSSFEPVMSKMSAEAITDLVLNGALNWITFGHPVRDDDYSKWLDTGIRSICASWRAQF